MKITNAHIWWGPPKKFSPEPGERKISWLELFYDLVYAIAISKTTHHLAEHPDVSGLLDYIYIFSMVFWGWLNGSMYYDIHGSPGIRTRFMTLWQMMILAALVVTFTGPPETVVFRGSISIIIMQVYITYLWWSVGIYDKHHRSLNVPYTICYLVSLALITGTLFLSQPYVRTVFYVSLILNYLPPFLLTVRLRRNKEEFNLSSSMTERLGLFTIIIFGEAVAGVISGTAELRSANSKIWINFGLGIIIVFALWWIFFSMIADRQSRKGFLNGYFTQMAYIPALMSLGMIGASFSRLFNSFKDLTDIHSIWIKNIFGISLSVFLLSIICISYFLEYPGDYKNVKGKLQRLLFATAIVIVLLTLMDFSLGLFVYLLVIFLLLLIIIIAITRIWVIKEMKKAGNNNF